MTLRPRFSSRHLACLPPTPFPTRVRSAGTHLVEEAGEIVCLPLAGVSTAVTLRFDPFLLL